MIARRVITGAWVCLLVTANAAAVAVASPQGGSKKCLTGALQKLFTSQGGENQNVTPAAIRTAIQDSLRRGFKPRVVAAKAGKFIFYPTVAPFRVAEVTAEMYTKHGVRGLVRVPFEYLKQDGVTILGFALFNHLVEGSPIQAAEFLLLPMNRNGKFQDDTRVPPRRDGIMVYIDGVPDNNVIAGYGENDFNVRFAGRSNAYYLHPSGVLEMMSQLQTLSQITGKPIAELEILGHGLPGLIEIGSDALRSSGISQIQGYSVAFAKDAVIRFQSCGLGANFRGSIGKAGENFMYSFGASLLKRGGTVVASNRTIYVADNFPKSARKYKQPFSEAYFEMFLGPLEGAIAAGLEALKTQDGPYRKVRIPARY